MYIKYSDKAYQGDENLREILSISGKTLIGKNTIEILENMVDESFGSKSLVLFDISNQKIILKTQEMKDKEILKKTQQEILNRFKPLIDAMTFQEISKQKGSNPEKAIFTNQEIKDWGDYISEIVGGNVEADMPEIPGKYQKIM
jgi:hypothetical protein